MDITISIFVCHTDKEALKAFIAVRFGSLQKHRAPPEFNIGANSMISRVLFGIETPTTTF
ncbi:hypothetical protein VroAM7_46620 [Vibrio rotiferianus]|uniref:Uncharacterized protein n=1 Tax=Vibrio rotiferianus TaxID=190895 RepID=A0A510IE70_9VIBR|nr:hypothetical protein VroAM7_46620 [Vibrio rotiferianus]